jgi:hypothetical protein
MVVKTHEKLCKFQNSGFCKFETKCHFKHVFDNCDVEGCDTTGCFKRHPKRCRYYFLKRFCKFQESCHYSHGEGNSHEDIAIVRLEIEKIKKKNEELESETMHLKLVNLELINNLKMAKEEVNLIMKEKNAIHTENKEIKEVNEHLLEDINVINERIGNMIPGKLEEENLELKESNAILKCLLQMHKNEERNQYNVESEDIETIPDDEKMESSEGYSCESCPFRSSSQQGLKIHIGIKHKGNKFNVNNKPSVS